VGARALPQNLITEKGAFQLYAVKMGRGQLRGQLEPNGDTIRFAFSIASA